MNKYWRIGTGAMTYVNKFKTFIEKNELYIKDYFVVLEKENCYLAQLKNGKVLGTWTSKATKNQDLIAWKAMGYISEYKNIYYISSNFKDIKTLIGLSLLIIISISNDEEVERYRKTIIINILVAGKILNQYDLESKQIFKGTNLLDIKDVQRSISNYEKEVIKNKPLIMV